MKGSRQMRKNEGSKENRATVRVLKSLTTSAPCQLHAGYGRGRKINLQRGLVLKSLVGKVKFILKRH